MLNKIIIAIVIALVGCATAERPTLDFVLDDVLDVVDVMGDPGPCDIHGNESCLAAWRSARAACVLIYECGLIEWDDFDSCVIPRVIALCEAYDCTPTVYGGFTQLNACIDAQIEDYRSNGCEGIDHDLESCPL